MAIWEPDEIDFEDQYDKVDPIDDADLDASMTLLNELKRVQEELQERLSRSEWTSMNKDERTELEQQIVLTRRNRGNTSSELRKRSYQSYIEVLTR